MYYDDKNRPVELWRWFEPHLEQDKLDMSKNSSTPQSEGALNGMINCWQSIRFIYNKSGKYGRTLCLLIISSVPVAMVNNSPPFFFFLPTILHSGWWWDFRVFLEIRIIWLGTPNGELRSALSVPKRLLNNFDRLLAFKIMS